MEQQEKTIITVSAIVAAPLTNVWEAWTKPEHDFSGTYTDIQPTQLIAYEIEDGRTVEIVFSINGNETEIKESFEAENTNPIEMQKEGWQAIINNFKKYVESIN